MLCIKNSLCSLIFFTQFIYHIQIVKAVNETCPSLVNIECKDGLLLPVWKPVSNISTGSKVARAIVYFLALMYCFLGVSIIADRFMAAIEVITSKEKEVSVKTKTGEVRIISVRIWNRTVSNLTLMALGSSAPEILLSIIEICGKNFEAGEMGPGTIVGSAAFNLFCIIGICIVVIPKNQNRKIKHLGVFFVTASWSVLAYLWMYIIIGVSTPGKIDVWEAVVTFLFFPLTVLTAYVADVKIFQRKFLKKKYFAKSKKNINVHDDAKYNTAPEKMTMLDYGKICEEEEYENTRQDYIETIREIRKQNPHIKPDQLEKMAQTEILNKCPKSRAYYRIKATRQLTGSGNVMKKVIHNKKDSRNLEVNETNNLDITQVLFDPGHYTVMENVGSFEITVCRKGGDETLELSVDYSTEDGTAKANEDFIPVSGTLIFKKNETRKKITITIIDDDVFEEDEHFDVRLSNLKVLNPKYLNPVCQISDPSVATIMVLDDDHAGVFHFDAESMKVSESCQTAEIAVIRSSGGRGTVKLPFRTVSGTAKGKGQDFLDNTGFLLFMNDQTEAVINVSIIDDNEYEKDEYFFVELGEPILCDINESHNVFSRFTNRASLGDLDYFTNQTNPGDTSTDKLLEDDTGKPRLGNFTRIKIHIIESQEFKNTVDRFLKQGKFAIVVGTTSWKEQFLDAISVNSGDDDPLDGSGDSQDAKIPSCMDYVMHFLTVFWKVLFACVPPTDYMGGWLCFNVSICAIGFLTAIIGDLASSFGCSVGLTDVVTAISFVALGTSLPDTFASKVAAVGDQYADSSIVNVTGSNAVNVFLGIGIAWSIAAIVHAVRKDDFIVPPGSLGFSVTIYCIFAVLAIIFLFIRRQKKIGGELGGSQFFKWISALFFFLLWAIYVILVSLENYCIIKGF